MSNILEVATRHGTPVVLMTYASYVAPGYTLESFQRRELDYTLHQTPIEVWGSPANVVAGIEVHNRIVKELSADPPGGAVVKLVDQASLIPKSGIYFNDICHLTTAGSIAFVDNLIDSLTVLYREWSPEPQDRP